MTIQNNFFNLFEQPVNFDIDLKTLADKLHALQKQYHPDNASSSTQQQDDSSSVQSAQSALINHAYNTLKNPDSRAMHLLELSNQIINFDNSISDLDFLDDAMDIRMALDDYLQAGQIGKLQQLKLELLQRINGQADRFKQAYSYGKEQSEQVQSESWQTAIDATQKLKFLVKINRDIDTAIDDVARNQQEGDDDDLYV